MNNNPFMNFDEIAYLELNPDLVEALRHGTIRTGWEHFIDYGFYEDRKGVPRSVFNDIKAIMDNELTLPYPPEHLRQRVHGAKTLRSFRNVGRVVTLNMISALHKIGKLKILNEGKLKVLDFGCGNARVLRYLHALFPDHDYSGTDIDTESITWCQETLAQLGNFSSNDPVPPLAYNENTFDFVYSISVFTHLPEDMQFLWLEELHRVAKPGAYLLLTTHGEMALPSVSKEDRHHLSKYGYFYLKGSGTDGLPDFYQNAYHLHDYICSNWQKYFSIVEIIDRGVVGFQDLVICKNR
ncbi:MAG: class I SAM-dependent methyltransferase [Pseudomonadales bacterium]|nr:class I SAM-dependent methyltransferase [Pseudomonadales bacterium]